MYYIIIYYINSFNIIKGKSNARIKDFFFRKYIKYDISSPRTIIRLFKLLALLYTA